MTGALLLSLPHPGIVCDRCGAKLALIGKRSAVAIVLALAWFAAVFIAAGVNLRKPSVWLAVAGLPLFLAYFFAQGLAQVRLLRAGEKLNFHSDPLINLDERLADVRARSAQDDFEEAERVAEIGSPSRTDWVCRNCKAENPATFDICWNCSGMR
jgi:ribosomal protein L40E